METTTIGTRGIVGTTLDSPRGIAGGLTAGRAASRRVGVVDGRLVSELLSRGIIRGDQILRDVRELAPFDAGVGLLSERGWRETRSRDYLIFTIGSTAPGTIPREVVEGAFQEVVFKKDGTELVFVTQYGTREKGERQVRWQYIVMKGNGSVSDSGLQGPY